MMTHTITRTQPANIFAASIRLQKGLKILWLSFYFLVYFSRFFARVFSSPFFFIYIARISKAVRFMMRWHKIYTVFIGSNAPLLTWLCSLANESKKKTENKSSIEFQYGNNQSGKRCLRNKFMTSMHTEQMQCNAMQWLVVDGEWKLKNIVDSIIFHFDCRHVQWLLVALFCNSNYEDLIRASSPFQTVHFVCFCLWACLSLSLWVHIAKWWAWRWIRFVNTKCGTVCFCTHTPVSVAYEWFVIFFFSYFLRSF